jgi:hypothetical protein
MPWRLGGPRSRDRMRAQLSSVVGVPVTGGHRHGVLVLQLRVVPENDHNACVFHPRRLRRSCCPLWLQRKDLTPQGTGGQVFSGGCIRTYPAATGQLALSTASTQRHRPHTAVPLILIAPAVRSRQHRALCRRPVPGASWPFPGTAHTLKPVRCEYRLSGHRQWPEVPLQPREKNTIAPRRETTLRRRCTGRIQPALRGKPAARRR